MIATSRVYEVWRELSALYLATPPEHRDSLEIDYHTLHEWAGTGREGIRSLAELERHHKIATCRENNNRLGIRVLELLPYKTVRELIEGYTVPDEPINERTEIHDLEATTDADRRAAEAWVALNEVVEAIKARKRRSLWSRVLGFVTRIGGRL